MLLQSLLRHRWFIPSILLVALCIYHVLTLSISPLPWLDEVMFASLTHSVRTTGHYYFTLLPYHLNNQEALFYGPVYFSITSFFERILGIGIFQFRLVSFLSGLLMLCFSAGMFIRFLKLPNVYFILFLMLVALDPGIMASMHGGRMDLLAVSFMLASTYFVLYFQEAVNNRWRLLPLFLSGVFAALGLLTTPRSGILLVPISVMLFYSLMKHRNRQAFVDLLFWGIVILIPALGWIAHAFSNSGLFGANIHAAGTAGNWFGGNLIGLHHLKNYLPAQFVLMLIVFTGMLFWFINSSKESRSWLSFICVFNVLLFYALVFEVGTYYVLVAPFCYLFLFLASAEVSKTSRSYLRWLPILLLFFNVSYFVFKSVRLYQYREARNPEKIQAYIGGLIPAHSLVLGEAPFYYAATTNDLEFELVLPPVEMVSQAEDRYGKKGLPIYHIISQSRYENHKSLFDSLEATGAIVKAGIFAEGQSSANSPFDKVRKLSESYNCIVFRFNKHIN